MIFDITNLNMLRYQNRASPHVSKKAFHVICYCLMASWLVVTWPDRQTDRHD